MFSFLDDMNISQHVINKRLGFFISCLPPYLHPQQKKLVKEVFVNDGGQCNGYAFLFMRADLLNQTDKFIARLHRISKTDDATFKKMAVLLRLSNAAQQKLSPDEQELLTFAKEIYVFANSLLFAQSPFSQTDFLSSVPNQGAINQEAWDEILKVLSIDASPEEKIPDLSTKYKIAFNFTQDELAQTLARIIFPGDKVMISSTDHVVYLSRKGSAYLCYDPNDKIGVAQFDSIDGLVFYLTLRLFIDLNVNANILPIQIQILNAGAQLRPSPANIIKDILTKRPPEFSIDQPCWDGKTSVHLAADLGCDDILEVLLNHGANPSSVDSFGKTPAALAARNGHHPIYEILAKFNGDLSRSDNKGQRPNEAAQLFQRQKIDDNLIRSQLLYNLDEWIAAHNFAHYLKKTNEQLSRFIAWPFEKNALKYIQEYLEVLTPTERKAATLFLIRKKEFELLAKLLNKFPALNNIAIYFAVNENVEPAELQQICEAPMDVSQAKRNKAAAIIIAANCSRFNLVEDLFKHADLLTHDQILIVLTYLINNNQTDKALLLLDKRPDSSKNYFLIAVTLKQYSIAKHIVSKFDKYLTPINREVALEKILNTQEEFEEKIFLVQNLLNQAANKIDKALFEKAVQYLKQCNALKIDLTVLAKLPVDDDKSKRAIAYELIRNYINLAPTPATIIALFKQIDAAEAASAFLFTRHSKVVFQTYLYKGQSVTPKWLAIIEHAQNKILLLLKNSHEDLARLDPEVKNFLEIRTNGSSCFFERPSVASQEFIKLQQAQQKERVFVRRSPKSVVS